LHESAKIGVFMIAMAGFRTSPSKPEHAATISDG